MVFCGKKKKIYLMFLDPWHGLISNLPLVSISFLSNKWLVRTVHAKTFSACVILQFEPPIHKVGPSGLQMASTSFRLCLFMYCESPLQRN